MFVNTSISTKGMAVTREYSTVTLRQSFNVAAYQDQYLGMFWSIYLPSGLQDSSKSGWMTIVRNISIVDDVVRQSLLAICMSLLGQSNGKEWMVHEGLKLHTSAVKGVRRTLSKLSTRDHESALVATRALSAYEAS